MTIEIFEGGRLVGRSESAPAQLEPEPTHEPATIRTIYSFSGWLGVEDVFQLSGQYLNELKAVVADGQKRRYLTSGLLT